MTTFDKFRNCITEPRCRDCEGIPGVCEEEHQSVSIPKALALDVLNELKEQEAEIERLKRPDCEHAEHDRTGCLGYCGCTQDDEPIESCKRCEKYTGNVSEAVK